MSNAPTTPDRKHEVVVGVDGSPSSIAALELAVDEACRRGATLVVVHSWMVPMYGGYVALPMDPAPFEEEARQSLDHLVQRAGERAGDLKIESLLVCGPAGPELVNAAKDADLLVVGSRGRGGFVGMLFGSSSHYVLHHAPCPVVVVHQPAGGAE
jgi:nucleotide-binding universal stress UspA family protein